MAKIKAAGRRRLSKEHKEAISKSQSARWAKRKGARRQKAPQARGSRRMLVMPHGITVLRRNGNGRDIIEGNAVEIREAVRLLRIFRKSGH